MRRKSDKTKEEEKTGQNNASKKAITESMYKNTVLFWRNPPSYVLRTNCGADIYIFFLFLRRYRWSLWRSLLFLITWLVPHPFPPPIHIFPSSLFKTKAGSWKRSEVGKCIQWHRPDDSILRRPCNICFQPCLRAGTPCCAFCPTCSSHRAAVNGGLVHVHWSRNFS